MSIEAIKQALEELQYVLDSSVNEDLPLHANNFHRTIKILKQAIEQAEKNDFNPDWDQMAVLLEENKRLHNELERMKLAMETKLCVRGYEIQIADLEEALKAKREWVGLTEEEILQPLNIKTGDEHFFQFARAIEAKLREKNAYGWQSVENPTQYLDDLRGGDAT